PCAATAAPSVRLIATSRKRILMWRTRRQASGRHSTSCSARRETCTARPFRSLTNPTGGSKSFSTSRRAPRNPTTQGQRRVRRLNMNRRIPRVPDGAPERTWTETSNLTRRGFLRQAGAAALSWAAFSRLNSALPGTLPNPVGYSNISWPQDELSQALDTVSALGYQGMQLLGWVQEAYAGEKIAELKDRLQKLKLSAAALSCSKVKLRPD